VDRCLLIRLTSGRRLSGKARLLGGQVQGDVSFKGLAQLCEPVEKAAETAVVVAGGRPTSAAMTELRAQWPGGPTAVWHIRDLAYLFDQAPAESLEAMEGLAAAVVAGLASIADDLLAQICQLVQEWGLESRLGCFVHELHRRHDVLDLPAAGAVDLARYFPPARSGGAAGAQEVAADMLERVFAARESLERAFAEYEDRPQQIEMAQAVEQALSDSRPLVVEAGTGVGKSLAYLLPLAIHAAQHGKLCLVSTNTINLQQQLVEQDIPRLLEILDALELRITLLKGREHYLCLKRLKETWLSLSAGNRAWARDAAGGGEAGLLMILRLLLAFDGRPQEDFDALPSPAGLSQPERARLLGGIDCRFQTCLGDRCEFKTNCHYFDRRAAAMGSHIAVVNHALVFSLFSPLDQDADNVVTRSAAIVFDEAHNLESAITSQNTLEVTHQTPIDLANRILAVLQHELVSKRLSLAAASIDEQWRAALGEIQEGATSLPEWVRLSVEVRDQISSLVSQAADKGHVSATNSSQLTPPTASAGQRQVLDLLAKLAARLHAVLSRMRQLTSALKLLFGEEESDLYIDDDYLQMELQAVSIDLAEAESALAHWRPDDTDAITWFNCRPAGGDTSWDYRTAPLHVGPVFQGLLGGRDCVILCGATLTVRDRFDYLQESLGFSPETVGFTTWLQLDSPFDFARQSLLLVATDLAGPTGNERDRYLLQLEEVVGGVMDSFPRGVLVLFNSYRDLNHIAEQLAAHAAERRVLVQGVSGTRAELSERFRREGDKVLLATRSFWEGFDVAGEALTCVVLAKLPFANFRDPIHAGRQQAIQAEGGDSFRRYSLPQAVMQLKQGFGRLIRTKTDRGCVFLLDSRAASASYGSAFIESLPGPRIIRDGYRACLRNAAEFMKQGQTTDDSSRRLEADGG